MRCFDTVFDTGRWVGFLGGRRRGGGRRRRGEEEGGKEVGCKDINSPVWQFISMTFMVVM
jgi:hypothetical protein